MWIITLELQSVNILLQENSPIGENYLVLR